MYLKKDISKNNTYNHSVFLTLYRKITLYNNNLKEISIKKYCKSIFYNPAIIP